MELIKKLTIGNEFGLHARSAARIVELTKAHKANLFIKKDQKEVDGSSILSILTLSCPQDTEVEIRVTGEEAETLMLAVTDLFNRHFDEH